MKGVNWTCPICGQPTTLTDENITVSSHALTIDNAEGKRVLTTVFTVCPNPDCNKFSLTVGLGNAKQSGWQWVEKSRLKT